jgi:hypothetical protein
MGKTDAKSGASLPAEVRFVKLDKSWGGADGRRFHQPARLSRSQPHARSKSAE